MIDGGLAPHPSADGAMHPVYKRYECSPLPHGTGGEEFHALAGSRVSRRHPRGCKERYPRPSTGFGITDPL